MSFTPYCITNLQIVSNVVAEAQNLYRVCAATVLRMQKKITFSEVFVRYEDAQAVLPKSCFYLARSICFTVIRKLELSSDNY